MGKLDLTKNQPAYLADKSRKRKKPHESDQGESAAGRPEKSKKPERPERPLGITMEQFDPRNSWTVLNPEAFKHLPTPAIPINQIHPLVTGAIAAASGWNVSGPSIPTDPPRPVKKTKVSSSTLASAGSSECPLCGGPKHRLRDCLVPKGGIER